MTLIRNKPSPMNPEIIKALDLTTEEVAVYSSLVGRGPSPARSIATVSGLKRGMVYKALASLEIAGLVEKRDPETGVAVFYPAHPGVLRDIVAKKQESLAVARENLENSIGALVSQYNLVSGRPNVRFFEGEKGMEEVLDDSLYAKEEIRTYVDLEAIMKFIPKINEVYSGKREKLGIKKRGIAYDTPANREIIKDYHTTVTTTRFMPWNDAPTNTIVQIYDGKVSYLTLRPESMIGLIVEDPHIYATHKALFDFTWERLETVAASIQ